MHGFAGALRFAVPPRQGWRLRGGPEGRGEVAVAVSLLWICSAMSRAFRLLEIQATKMEEGDWCCSWAWIAFANIVAIDVGEHWYHISVVLSLTGFRILGLPTAIDQNRWLDVDVGEQITYLGLPTAIDQSTWLGIYMNIAIGWTMDQYSQY
jgi:hypothetical protein